MRKPVSFVLAILILVLSVLPAAASGLPLIIDSADLLTDSEEYALEQTALSLQQTYSTDIVILTVDTLGGKSAQNYADDYFDDHGYGAGGSGILFLLAMAEREWYISTYGDMIYAVTDYGIQDLGENAVWYFGEGYYYDGFDGYLRDLAGYLKAYQSGSPIDGYADDSGDYYHGDRETVVYYDSSSSPNLLLSLGIGVVVALIVILIMRASMNTSRRQSSASDYLRNGSFRLRTHQDLFLYSRVTKTRRQQNTGSGGGSSVHRSAGGRSHGGGGGRF